MNIFVTGGSGFIGHSLVTHLAAKGHQITILGRTHRTAHQTQSANPRFIQGNPVTPGPWQDEIPSHDAIINLAGASIFCRWNRENRRQIHDSRILTTRNIVKAMRHNDCRARVLLNGSAVGFYGDRGSELLDEQSSGGSGFLAEICQAWEGEARRAEEFGVRVVHCRLGVVLGHDGGALKKMLPLFRIGLGAQLGNGRQWFPWIHQTDLVRIFSLLLDNRKISGAINCLSPEQVTNADFTKTLAKVLHRPLLLPAAPAFIIRLAQGEASSLLLNSLRVSPRRLEETGFSYSYPTLVSALTDLVDIRLRHELAG